MSVLSSKASGSRYGTVIVSPGAILTEGSEVVRAVVILVSAYLCYMIGVRSVALLRVDTKLAQRDRANNHTVPDDVTLWEEKSFTTLILFFLFSEQVYSGSCIQ